jgi:hypothetical protein
MKTETSAVNINRNIGDFSYPEAHVRDAGAGLSERTVRYISDVKEDPDWVREFRLRGLKTFLEKPLPTHWASKDLEAIDFDKIRYYLSPGTEAFLSRSENFSPAWKRSSTARPSIQTSRKRSANRASFSLARPKD